MVAMVSMVMALSRMMMYGLMMGEVMMRGMMINKWEIVNMGMEEMQIKEMMMQIKDMVSQEVYMVNRLMVGEVMTKMMVGMRWDGREVNMLMRDCNKMWNMVVIVKVEMGEYMVKMMGPRVWERFMMVGEMMMRGMMVKKWEIVLIRDYSKVGDMVVFVQTVGKVMMRGMMVKK